MKHLVPCTACGRHVRVAELTCPFCATRLPDSLRTTLPHRVPSGRLGRAALLAFSTLVGTASVGCDANDDEDAGIIGSFDAAYGGADAGPVDVDAGGRDAGPDAGPEIPDAGDPTPDAG